MATPFWSNDLTVLLNKDYIFQVWPQQQMTFEAKLNAITRLVILLSVIGYLITQKTNFLLMGLATLAIIFTIYNFRKQSIIQSLTKKEGYANIGGSKLNPATLADVLKSDFHPNSKRNPFGNVLLTDIADNPERKAAAPAFNPEVYDAIDRSVKKQTQMLNPGIQNTNKQLYGDLWDNFELDQSMRRFYTTANTRVANDQGAYGNFLYGDMYSAKESTPEGAMMRVKDNYRYILI